MKTGLDSTDLTILTNVKKGLTAKEIAPIVHLSKPSVEKRLLIMRKIIGVNKSHQLIAYAYDNNLIK
jgi:DNA-binding CsgD family transcriptional regulator